ncbi:patatin-like phospholipase family protein [Ralstonia solanacearum]|uniref:patatin-like phospholipase family protein n=1 Tax=Ralstonia solanacearum TaxID=305 RepID=UPI00399D730A
MRRPRIGLVLSGGGARGYAHIGVLKMLERLRVPIDAIAGTSMGAVVGGLYASGLHADALEQRLSQVNLSDIAFDRKERAKLPQSLREDDFQYPIGLSAGYANGAFKLPAGLVQGNRLLALLKIWTAQWPDNIDFAHLPIPFRAMATDLATGDGVVLDHGSLALAMRASMRCPACSRRSRWTAARCWTAAWSVTCQCNWRATWAWRSSSPSISGRTCGGRKPSLRPPR